MQGPVADYLTPNRQPPSNYPIQTGRGERRDCLINARPQNIAHERHRKYRPNGKYELTPEPTFVM
ncbi:hypothetical protein AWC22_03835 [Mycobacterium riyadhense]|uniref:Uncharacterized protein n=1 Tax=Mycobacterium riyadhense TaxID=486698 RepID=A0A1X2BGY0_9MYCO|nr:hypothetical protein AWC22_03835 [Mycobacterium riyadhense]